METTDITLTDTWQEVAIGACIVDSKGGYSVQIRNADSLPSGVQAHHTIAENDSLSFSVPASGAWYGRCIFGNTVVSVTALA